MAGGWRETNTLWASRRESEVAVLRRNDLLDATDSTYEGPPQKKDGDRVWCAVYVGHQTSLSGKCCSLPFVHTFASDLWIRITRSRVNYVRVTAWVGRRGPDVDRCLV